MDAERPQSGPAAEGREEKRFDRQVQLVAPRTHPHGRTWKPGGAPSQALDWEVQALAKTGTLSIIGVYPQAVDFFPIGAAMMKNLTINMGNCNHRKYIPDLVELVENGTLDPVNVLTQVEPLTDVMNAYEAFHNRRPGRIKVEVVPGTAG